MAKVNSVRFDQWHIVSGSSDHTARLWITQGKYRWSIATYPHPRYVLVRDKIISIIDTSVLLSSEVFSVQFVSLRVVTGCADGKVGIESLSCSELLSLGTICFRCVSGIC